ncbi:MAG: hypothetical protein SGILL_000568 [Bacillariaceae sp.]
MILLQEYCDTVEEGVWQQLNAYVAGVLTVCTILFCKSFLQALELVPDNLQSSGDDDDDDNLTWIDPWNAPMEAASRIVQASLNNIGELPIPFKRQHWPWETIRQRFQAEIPETADEINLGGNLDDTKRRSHHDKKNDDTLSLTRDSSRESGSQIFIDACLNGETDDDSLTLGSTEFPYNHDINDTSAQESLAKKKKDSLCIGSILGLDVGGTLAKLVYFEQKRPDFDSIQTSLHQRHSSVAASAHAITVAKKEREARENQIGRMKRYTISSNNLSTAASENDMAFPTRSGPPVSTIARRRSFTTSLLGHSSDPIVNDEEKERLDGDDHEDEQVELDDTRLGSLPADMRQFRHSVDFQTLKENTFKDIFKSTSATTDDIDDDAETYTSEEMRQVLGGSTASMTRSKSLFDMSSQIHQQKAEALDRFYAFARRLGDEEESIRDHKLSFYSRELGGEFHFIRFETRRMRNAMDLIRYNNLHLNIHEMGATGGGAHKFAEVWERELGIQMDKQDELDSLVAGMQFVLSTVIGECYTFRPAHNASERESADGEFSDDEEASQVGLKLNESIDEHSNEEESSSRNEAHGGTDDTQQKMKMDEWWWSRKVQRDSISYSASYPYLLVTIGTGVSVLRVDGPRKYERISGSTIGGGTYWGLMRLLTDVESFDDAMTLAEIGDPSKVDMMVGDIYGTNSDALEKLGLPANIVASSFGKLVAKEEPAKDLTQEDLARALLLLVTNNIGQVSYLNAKLCNTRRIYFVGSFLRQNTISQQRLSYAIDFWSKGEMEALFLEHEGYFGALGAFLKSQNIEKREEGFFQWEDSPHAQAWRHRKW